MSKKWEEKEVPKLRMNALPIGDTLDSNNPLLKLQDVMTIGKDDVMVIAEVRFEGSVLKENHPMINVFTRVQDNVGCVPINVHGEAILK